MKVKLDLPIYAIKSCLKGVTGINTSHFTKKADLANLKSDVDRLVINPLETTPTDLSTLIVLVKNKVVKKSVHYELVKKVHTINSNKQDLEKKD